MTDVVFISYDEKSAENNWQHLLQKKPKAKRIHGITGILKAHQYAAIAVNSEWFFVVDGDSYIHDDFNFALPEDLNIESIYVWRSRNPVNGLIYGYGGVKLFHKTTLSGIDNFNMDMSTTIAKNYIPMPQIASTTMFNATPFLAWRGAFRECAKLALPRQKAHHEKVRVERLQAWCHKGEDADNGVWAIKGAREGLAYGEKNQTNTEKLNLINDFSWLKRRFWSNHQGAENLLDKSVQNNPDSAFNKFETGIKAEFDIKDEKKLSAEKMTSAAKVTA